jgi:predicted naringenin-chalcone synthase
MREYERLAYPLAREALEACLARAEQPANMITDLIVASCTGYSAPGLDIFLARDLGMQSDVRRLIIGHMGCHGAIIGLRNALAALRAHEDGVVALIAVELCSLHFSPRLDVGVLASLALFGDAAGALALTACGGGQGPELVDTYCAADFDAAEQMSWKITDEGFLMGLSRRIPLTLRRHVDTIACRLLTPHGLAQSDITHWIVHPGGPDILEVVADKLGLSDEQTALSRQVLREHGNCSAPTVLLVLDRLLRSGQTHPGEWGVMMAFGPGLTLEMCLLRF